MTGFPGYERYTTAQLLEAYAAGPQRLRAALAGLTEDELRARPRGPATWSAHEIAMHVCDSEIQGAYRMRQVLAERDPELPASDQDAWARRLGYQATGDGTARGSALELFVLLRGVTLPLLHRATPSDWERSGRHAVYGTVTLRNLLELYADHSERHLGQVLTIRRLLGKALDCPLLLPHRLY